MVNVDSVGQRDISVLYNSLNLSNIKVFTVQVVENSFTMTAVDCTEKKQSHMRGEWAALGCRGSTLVQR